MKGGPMKLRLACYKSDATCTWELSQTRYKPVKVGFSPNDNHRINSGVVHADTHIPEIVEPMHSSLHLIAIVKRDVQNNYTYNPNRVATEDFLKMHQLDLNSV